MNLEELKEKLLEIGADLNKVSLDTDYKDERPGIGILSGQWQVFYNERGKQETIKKFDCESDACEFYLEDVKNNLRFFS